MDDRQNLLGRRWIVGVMLMAAEQAPRILEVCAATPGDEKDLNRALREAFDIGEMDAEVILSMPVRRFAPVSVERIRAELADIEERLALTEPE
ncbi:hypothetical protein [Microbacterium sp. H1-D42]|uniref:hypothetical protein n=1 Tax=Microbacterium sp. H1-D42 TaxID=2925844 RepID=UPI001F53C26A|nr:hypothetical protein [Microbacterium sp. H1-D42]UNK70285.1 hypothetical protein MNR00_14110 [Microbacterium sp. H1-D42]